MWRHIGREFGYFLFMRAIPHESRAVDAPCNIDQEWRRMDRAMFYERSGTDRPKVSRSSAKCSAKWQLLTLFAILS